jgi:ribonuclease HI
MHDGVALKVYTDGSCLKNPGGPGGAAVIAEYPDHIALPTEMVSQEGYAHTTNNRMELRACIEGLRFIARRGENSESRGRSYSLTHSTFATTYLARGTGRPDSR